MVLRLLKVNISLTMVPLIESSNFEQKKQPGDDVPNVSVNYRNMNPYQTGFDGDGNPANHVADVLTQVKSISLNQAPVTKPTVICAKPTSPHVQVIYS